MKKIIYLLVVMLLVHCKQRYDAPPVSPVSGYLVVEGHINSNGGTTAFQLSRTVALSGNRVMKTELNARLQVEDQNSGVFPLGDKGKGLYSADALNLNLAQKYRLRIKTASGTEYLSDFVDLRKTPAIDSINWKREGDGVHVYVNAHDDLNNTHYYLWNYIETWEYHSSTPTSFKYENNQVLLRTPAEQVFRCWTTQASTNIFINSTLKLTRDVVYQNQMVNIPNGSQKLSVLYSILVKQYALSSQAYSFLESMKKNTESLGSVFDPQPSELQGNIHAVNRPDEPVVGFVTAGAVIEKRIYINRSEIGNWSYNPNCPLPDTLVANKPDSLKKYFGSGSYLPISEDYGPGGITGYFSNETNCLDCRLRGGINVKPAFWP